MRPARTLMVQGTGSGVGKSVLVSALCRILVQDGLRVAPFKAQNMALNSFVTPSGGEIGRAQAAQAQAARVIPTVDMNPVLMKPSSDIQAQIIVQGQPLGNKSAIQYDTFKRSLFGIVKASLARLRKEHDAVIMEGAGSPAEVNLRKNDIVNMSIALASRTPVILVGDIDKGGVLASIVGTLALLTPAERRLVKGIIINKFRGDLALFDDGVHFLEKRTGIPVLGVLPYYRDIAIPEEDAVPLESLHAGKRRGPDTLTAAVIYLPHISNFTDFDALAQEPDVQLRYCRRVEDIGRPDVLIIPGTKNTIADLAWLRKNGMAEKIQACARSGKTTIVGICGGYQMLGTEIRDPGHIESKRSRIEGFSLLPVRTVLKRQKQLRQVEAVAVAGGHRVRGYEIHHGETEASAEVKPVFMINGKPDGAAGKDGRVWGTYIHGVFDADDFRRHFLNAIRKRKNLKPLPVRTYDADIAFDKLAAVVRTHIDLKAVRRILEAGA